MPARSLLSMLLWLPVLGGVVVMLLGDRRASLARWLSLAVSVVTFLLTLHVWAGYEIGGATWQFVERHGWIPTLHSDYYLGVDGISLPLIVLTAFTTVLVVIAGWSVIEKRPSQYYAAFLIM